MNWQRIILFTAIVTNQVHVACFMIISPPAQVSSRAEYFRVFASDDNQEPDLFEYFDPLLSPHAYPNGIKPDSAPVDNFSEREKIPFDSSFGSGSGLTLLSSIANEVEADNPPSKKTPAIDPNVFDPLLSPHMYPNGTPDNVIGDKKTSTIEATSTERVSEEESLVPLGTSDFVSLLTSVSASDRSVSSAQEPVVDPDYFDPLLSPHMYPNGTPDRFVGDEPVAKKRIGVLLMDHGSRNQASNERLHELAKLYQASVDSSTYVVTAAHMEIAQPDIPTGLSKLLEENVDEIICHPYFLSAAGRHVSEDIPAILKQAMEDLKIDVPVITTEPVGSQTSVMIGLIQNLVQQNSQLLNNS